MDAIEAGGLLIGIIIISVCTCCIISYRKRKDIARVSKLLSYNIRTSFKASRKKVVFIVGDHEVLNEETAKEMSDIHP